MATDMENTDFVPEEQPPIPFRPATPDPFAGRPVIASVDDMTDEDYERLKPIPLAAYRGKREVDNTFWYHLNTMSLLTGEKIRAQVKIVNVMDRAVINTVPVGVRELIQKLFFTAQANQRGSRKEPTPEQRTKQAANRQEEVGRAYACAGFVEPRLVLNEHEVPILANGEPDPNVWWVGHIPWADLNEFARICEGDDQLAERRLEAFSEQPDVAV